MTKSLNPKAGLAALKRVELAEDNPAARKTHRAMSAGAIIGNQVGRSASAGQARPAMRHTQLMNATPNWKHTPELAPKAHQDQENPAGIPETHPAIQKWWTDIKQRCTQTKRFESDVRQVFTYMTTRDATNKPTPPKKPQRSYFYNFLKSMIHKLKTSSSNSYPTILKQPPPLDLS